MKVDIVQFAIRKAFADVPKPPLDDIVHPHTGCTECESIRNELGTKTQNDLLENASVLRGHSQSIFFLTKKAYLYFLPVFINYSLHNFDDAEDFSQSILFSFLPDSGDWSGLSLLDSEQKRAVKEYVRYVIANQPGIYDQETQQRFLDSGIWKKGTAEGVVPEWR